MNHNTPATTFHNVHVRKTNQAAATRATSDGKTTPVIIVANHMSHADPLVLAHYVYDAGRWPVFLAKASVFKVPVIGPWLRAVDRSRGVSSVPVG